MTLDDLELHECEFLGISRISDVIAVKRMKIGQYCQRQRCRNVELQQFWQAFASRGLSAIAGLSCCISYHKVNYCHGVLGSYVLNK